jgi:cobaltochelatase CobN
MEGYGFEPASPLPEMGFYHPDFGEAPTLEELLSAHDPARPTVGVVFYRAHWMGGNTAFVDSLVGRSWRPGLTPCQSFATRCGPAQTGRARHWSS